MRNTQSPLLYIRHIRDALEKLIRYTDTTTYEEFVESKWDQDAVMRNLGIIGEAANKLEASFYDSYPTVPWRKIIDFRNVVIHEYADLDIRIVWQILQKDLPALYNEIQKILKEKTSS